MIASRQMRSAINTLPPKRTIDISTVEKSIIKQPTPVDIHIIRWFIFQIWTPRRIVRFLIWGFSKLARWYVMVRTFGLAIIGGKVTETEYAARQILCRKCPANKRDYCKSCSCWKWPPAKLAWKNRLREWRCPEKRHPGRYVEWHDKRNRGSCYGNKPQMGVGNVAADHLHPTGVTQSDNS